MRWHRIKLGGRLHSCISYFCWCPQTGPLNVPHVSLAILETFTTLLTIYSYSRGAPSNPRPSLHIHFLNKILQHIRICYHTYLYWSHHHTVCACVHTKSINPTRWSYTFSILDPVWFHSASIKQPLPPYRSYLECVAVKRSRKKNILTRSFHRDIVTLLASISSVCVCKVPRESLKRER